MAGRYWIPDEKLCYAPAWQIRKDAEVTVYKNDAGIEASFPRAEAETFPSCSDAQLQGADNIVTMDSVNPGALLHNVRQRFSKKVIYTAVADILIALNPFEPLSIYSSKHVDMYASGTDQLPPHVYNIGSSAFRGLMDYGTNQAILVSGESGAGKTESTKLVLSYIAEVSSSKQDSVSGIEQQILQVNPVLEAFGNAATTRNDNSSRFGKWIEVCFSPKMEIQGSRIYDYLLEVTRICHQNEGEGNYHIFYQLLAHESRTKYNLTRPEDYNFLSRRMRKINQSSCEIDDSKDFRSLQQSLSNLDFSAEVQNEMFSIIASILHLGNVEFDEVHIADGNQTGSKPKSSDGIKQAAQMIGVEASLLETSITYRSLTFGKEVTLKPLEPSQAVNARDSLAKILYGKMFKAMLLKINSFLKTEEMQGDNWIGLLDIAGFETFPVNSLEQIFINLSNEELQHHFNDHVFKSELDEYARQGMPIEKIAYADNTDCLQLIRGKDGLFDVLDEEVNMPKGTDSTYNAKICSKFKDNSRFLPPKFSGKNVFSVLHFADKVEYTTDGWLEKNVDQIPSGLVDLLKPSTNSVVRDIVSLVEQECATAPVRGKKKTVASAYKDSLKLLIEKIVDATPHFIRCIKPNTKRTSTEFDAPMVMQQLTYSGVIEAVKIRQSGYALRLPFTDFFRRYGLAFPKRLLQKAEISGGSLNTPTAAQMIVDILPDMLGSGISLDDFAVGKVDMIFIRQNAQKELEQYRQLAISNRAVVIQRYWKGLRCRRDLKATKDLFRKIAAWLSVNGNEDECALAKLGSLSMIDSAASAVEALIESALDVYPVPPNVEVARRVFVRLRKESELIKAMEKVDKEESRDALEINRICAQALDCGLTVDIFPLVEKLQMRAVKLKVQLPLLQALECVDLSKNHLDDFVILLDAVKEAGIESTGWILPKGDEYTTALKERIQALEVEIAEEKRRMEEERKRIEDEKRRLEEEKKRMEEEARIKEEERLKAERDAKEAAIELARLELERQQKAQEEERIKAEHAALEAKEKEEAARLRAEQIEAEQVAQEIERVAREQQLAAIEAEEVARKEKAREIKQARKQTIAGMTQDDQNTLLKKLETAAHEYDADALEVLLREAIQNGIAEEQLNVYSELFTNLQKKHFVRGLIVEAQNDEHSRKRLENLAKQGEKLGLVDIRRQTLAPTSKRGTIAEEEKEDPGDYNLWDFSNLHDARKWQGTKSSGIGRLFGGNKENMLVHSSAKILGPLTKMSSADQSKVAVQTFRDILGWMGDKPIQEHRRAGLAIGVVNTAKSHPQLCDEIYVQIMKQLTGNPSLRSDLLGRRLFLLLCQQAAPSKELLVFVRSFIKKAMDSDNPEIALISKQSLADLVKTAAEGENVSDDGSGEETVKVHVELMDLTSRQAFVTKTTTLSDLSSQMAVLVGLRTGAKDFSFFQKTESLEVQRLLPDTGNVIKLLDKWKKLEQDTTKRTCLVWKRRFLRGDESLRASDIVHARLTYYQALVDYLKYPFWEPPETIAKVAATILSLEMDKYAKEISKNSLDAPSVLEDLVAPSMMEHMTRKKWSTAILGAYKNHYQVFDTESRMQKTNRAFNWLQKVACFGAHYWKVMEDKQVTEERLSMEVPDDRLHLGLNPKNPEQPYYIVVDGNAIRFISTDPGPQKQRGFFYAEGAMDRVLRWGAKKNGLQIVVQTLNPREAARGPMTIALITQHAIDCAWIVHKLVSECLDLD